MYTNYPPAPTLLGLLPLDNRRFLHMATLCHKSIYFDDQASLGLFFVPVVPVVGRSTRACDTVTMKVPRMRTCIGQQSFNYRGPKFWNGLPVDVRKLNKYLEFKRVVSRDILNLFENHPTWSDNAKRNNGIVSHSYKQYFIEQLAKELNTFVPDIHYTS